MVFCAPKKSIGKVLFRFRVLYSWQSLETFAKIISVTSISHFSIRARPLLVVCWFAFLAFFRLFNLAGVVFQLSTALSLEKFRQMSIVQMSSLLCLNQTPTGPIPVSVPSARRPHTVFSVISTNVSVLHYLWPAGYDGLWHMPAFALLNALIVCCGPLENRKSGVRINS
jgi:hypothetical protein